jgi:ATP-dependent RNA helicase DBP3
MLVLAPTRELAMQSHVVIEEFGSLVGLTSLVLYGGVPKYEQKDALKKGVDCVVATPGRIKDLINEGSCDLSKVSQLVLDEADRMLGKCLKPNYMKLCHCVPLSHTFHYRYGF